MTFPFLLYYRLTASVDNYFITYLTHFLGIFELHYLFGVLIFFFKETCRRRICLGHQNAGLASEFLLLRLRDHPDPLRHFGQEVWLQVLPRCRDADKFSVRSVGPGLGPMGRLLLANTREVYPGARRGK